MTQTTVHLEAAKAALTSAVAVAPSVSGEHDAQLLKSTALVEELSNLVDTLRSRYAGEIAVRSRAELRDSGLAARRGFLNATALVRDVTKSSYRDAARRVRVGVALAERDAAVEDAQRVAAADVAVALAGGGEQSASAGNPERPLDPITAAVAEGRLAADSADQMLRILSPIVEAIDTAQLRRATESLVQNGLDCHADELARRARGLRDNLNKAGVADREERLRSQRSLRKGAIVDGLRRVSLVLDPESDAVLVGAIDAAMSPRLGGPRFVDPLHRGRTEQLIADARSNEQIALDTLVELVRMGAARDGDTPQSPGAPVRVTISLADLGFHPPAAQTNEKADEKNSGGEARRCKDLDLALPAGEFRDDGVGWLEGHPEPLSASTVRRILCANGALPIVLGGESVPLDVGRTRRLFTGPQRVALAIRDGGCRWPDCERPPAWSEAHHITPFSRGGVTNLADGILLCRRHHLLMHNNGWRIHRTTHEYWLTPPAILDPSRSPIPLPSKRSLPSNLPTPSNLPHMRGHTEMRQLVDTG